MQGDHGGYKSHQRSYIRCQNTTTSEDTTYLGSGNTEGIQTYNRTGVTIANGNYPGNSILHFEMRAWRTAIGTTCNPTYNKVKNFTWIITVNYAQIPDEGSVGIGTTTPATSAILDLTSITQALLLPRMTTAQRDAIPDPIPGMVLFNTTTQKMEVFSSGWGGMDFSSPSVKKLFGGSTYDYVTSIQQTSDGGFIVIGNAESSNSGTLAGLNNFGSADYWIMKLDNSGNVSWQKLLGGNGRDEGYQIQQTSDGGFIVTGYSESSNSGTLTGLFNHGSFDYWIIRLDNLGNLVWQNLLGGSNPDFAYSIIQTSDGGFIAAGYSESSDGTLAGLMNNGIADFWIYKMDAAGNLVWQKLLGGVNDDIGQSIQEINDGGFIVAGISHSSNTGTLTGLFNNGLADYWIIKLDIGGNVVWQKLYGGNNIDLARSVQQTNDGGFIVAGTSSSTNLAFPNFGSDDYWILKLDDSGNILWQKVLGGSLDDRAFSIKQTADNGYIITGSSNSNNSGTLQGLTNNGQTDYWVVKLDTNGNINWQKLLGGSNSDGASDLIQTTDNGYIICGSSNSSNTGTLLGLINNGAFDAWILKLNASGNPY